MINKKRILNILATAAIAVLAVSCSGLEKVTREANTNLPEQFGISSDTINSAQVVWKNYFSDPYLLSLIDTALNRNRELAIAMQEIEIARNEARARKGEYLPQVGVGLGAGTEKVGRYTSQGANDANTDIEPGREMPDPLPDYVLGAHATWEIDVWKKLRNARKSALKRYLASIEGRNFMITNLVAEIADDYYELLALDNQLKIVKQNIEIQNNALEIVKLQKKSAKTTELAVRRFEAQVLKTKSLQYDIRQQITEVENHLNFLLGRYPQHIERNSTSFEQLMLSKISEGIPSQMLQNRPDIREAEMALEAAKLDVKVAKAKFYPSFGITANVGLQAFDPEYLIKTPQSLIFSVAGDMMAPLINRKALKANYNNANAKQLQAIFEYEQTILNAFVEVRNELARVENLKQSYSLKQQQVEALSESVSISNKLFKSARADYMEVLLTQREALESKFELIETKKNQLNATINLYRALGGGWR